MYYFPFEKSKISLILKKCTLHAGVFCVLKSRFCHLPSITERDIERRREKEREGKGEGERERERERGINRSCLHVFVIANTFEANILEMLD